MSINNSPLKPKVSYTYSNEQKEDNPVEAEKIANLINTDRGTHYNETDTERIWNESIKIIQAMNDNKRQNGGEYEDNYTQSLKRKYKWYYKNYPSLFLMITDLSPGNENQGQKMKRLKEMINLIDKVKMGYIDYEKASKKIGKEYYDEFHSHKVD
jgi:hypothetical protein